MASPPGAGAICAWQGATDINESVPAIGAMILSIFRFPRRNRPCQDTTGGYRCHDRKEEVHLSTPEKHADHQRQLPRLRRIEGQVRGIAGMVEDGRYCVDILTQLQAARAALARVEREILDDHVGACVNAAAASGDVEATRLKMIELTELLRRAVR